MKRKTLEREGVQAWARRGRINRRTLRTVPLWRDFSPVVRQWRALSLWHGATARPTAFCRMNWLPSLLLALDWKTTSHVISTRFRNIFLNRAWGHVWMKTLGTTSLARSPRQEAGCHSESYRVHLRPTWDFGTLTHACHTPHGNQPLCNALKQTGEGMSRHETHSQPRSLWNQPCVRHVYDETHIGWRFVKTQRCSKRQLQRIQWLRRSFCRKVSKNDTVDASPSQKKRNEKLNIRMWRVFPGHHTFISYHLSFPVKANIFYSL